MILFLVTYTFFFLEEFIMLRTLYYHKRKSNTNITMPFIYSGSFETRSTTTTMVNDHYLFYSDIRKLRIRMTKEKPKDTCFSSLFQQIDYLIIEMPIIRFTFWNYLLNISKNNRDKFG